MDPASFKDINFEEFMNDPLGHKDLDPIKRQEQRYNSISMKKNYDHTVLRGKEYGYDMQ